MKREIIFMDAEFPQLSAYGTEFLSIALIKPSGEELYLEIETEAQLTEWVQRNVVPYLIGNKTSKEEAKKQLLAFIGPNKPYFVSFVPCFDWMGICAYFGPNKQDLPFYWIPIDFANILLMKGIDPEQDKLKLAKSLRIDTSGLRLHNAIDDARLLKKLWEKVNPSLF
ncbi:MAG TPA: hypothetical protein VJG90_04095 [Candidatus Nanoarchaeia archaeon]|nr:hypothetical protein [Candidatus Nanoarchaeia archaeon]